MPEILTAKAANIPAVAPITSPCFEIAIMTAVTGRKILVFFVSMPNLTQVANKGLRGNS